MLALVLSLLPFIVPVSAVYFNSNGNVISNSYMATSNLPSAQFTTLYAYTNQPTPFNGTFLIVGFGDGGTCAASLIKTWEGTTPPSDLYAVAVTSGRCLYSIDSSFSNGTIISDYTVSNTDTSTNDLSTVAFNRYYNYQGSSKLVTTTLKTINFAVSSLIDIGVVQINMKASDLVSQGFFFYSIADSALSPSASIRNIGFMDVDFVWYNMRSMTGSAVTNVSYTPRYGRAVYNSTAHTSNIYSTGAPMFLTTDNTTIYAVTTEEGRSSYNYAQSLYPIKNCFKSTGVFSLNTPDCLTDFKTEYYAEFNIVVEGMRYISKENVTESNIPTDNNYASQVLEQLNLTTSDVSSSFDQYNVTQSTSSQSRLTASWLFIPMIVLTMLAL